MRKQRRQAELQDKRDRIRLGLIPPDPPKGLSVPYCIFHTIPDISTKFALRI